MPTLTSREGVYVLDLGADENRFTPEWMSDVESALDAVEAAPAPLVIVGDGKFFSNGLDLAYVSDLVGLPAYTRRVQTILSRILTLPAPTVAAINGHAFGAGAMLAIACDWRYMREDRGFFCFPEVDIHIPFTLGMAALIQGKLSTRTAVDSMTTGHRFGAEDALVAGIVDGVAAEGHLVDTAIARVGPLAGKAGDTLGQIKQTMFGAAARALTEN